MTAPATTTAKLASEKQSHWLGVFAGRFAADAALINAVSAATLTTVMDSGADRPVTARDASAALDELFALPRPARADAAPLAAGGYLRDGVAYRVQISKSSGRPYAMTLDPTAKVRNGEPAPGWVYSAGAIFNLTAEHAMTWETAIAYGAATGICAVCAATLGLGTSESSAESVRRGIGPVCAKRFGG